MSEKTQLRVVSMVLDLADATSDEPSIAPWGSFEELYVAVPLKEWVEMQNKIAASNKPHPPLYDRSGRDIAIMLTKRGQAYKDQLYRDTTAHS